MAGGEPGPEVTNAALEAAIEALSEPGRMQQAEAVVARMAPQLQLLLTQILAEGGWFEDAHHGEVRKAADLADPAERAAAIEALLIEETRLGMLVGVAVGWELASELGGDGPG
jgi:hypothetical protein